MSDQTHVRFSGRLTRNLPLGLISIFVFGMLAGCGGDAKLAEENAQLKARVAALEAENQQLQAKLAPAGQQGQATMGAASGFTDVAGIDAEQAIKDLATLGVFDSQSGKFEPSKPITRAEYATWLVKANNATFPDDPSHKIHLAGADDKPTFVDVSSANPSFKWIQGLASAGYIVGIDPTHFAPDQPLTREQMVGIKAQIDESAPIKSDSAGTRDFIHVDDNKDIDFAYLEQIHEDYSARTTNNIQRIWGNTKVLHPKKPVTRAEAAVSLCKISNGSAAQTLKNKKG